MRPVNTGKKRLLYLKKYFEECTNENRDVTMGDILRYLERHGIEAERKSVLSDIDALEEFGMDIQRGDGNKTYYLNERDFDLAELKLIVDWIASSKFLSEKKSEELIEKIGKLTDIFQRRELKRRVVVSGRVKSMNSTVLYSVDTIQSAIANRGYIDFKYYQYNMKKEREFKHNGKTYHVHPRYLLYDNNTYYLLADEGDELKTFRVDRMASVKQTEETEDDWLNFSKPVDIESFMKSTFGMFHGEETVVKIIFHRDMMDTVIDKFGKDVKVEIVDNDHFRVTEKIAVSPQFFGWIFGLGTNAMIEYPLKVAKQMKDLLKERHKAYREEHSRNIYFAK